MTGLKTYLVAYTAGFGDRVLLGKKALRIHEACREALGGIPTPVMISADNLFSLHAVVSEHDHSAVYLAITKRLGKDFVLGDRPQADRLLVCEAGAGVGSDSVVMASIAFNRKLQPR